MPSAFRTCVRTFFAASCFDRQLQGKISPFLKIYAMFSKYFVGKIYQSLISRVFTIPGAFAMPDVQAATNFIRPMLSCCSELIPNSPNETCCRTRHKPNETSRCTRWPLSQLTHCGHVLNKTSVVVLGSLATMTYSSN